MIKVIIMEKVRQLTLYNIKIGQVVYIIENNQIFIGIIAKVINEKEIIAEYDCHYEYVDVKRNGNISHIEKLVCRQEKMIYGKSLFMTENKAKKVLNEELKRIEKMEQKWKEKWNNKE